MPKGTRVVRGPHWTDDNKDGGGPGTVTSNDPDGPFWVMWDCETVSMYNGGLGGRFDIRPLVLLKDEQEQEAGEEDEEEEGEEEAEKENEAEVSVA